MSEPVLVDTGPLVAILAEDDAAHARCKEVLEQLREPLMTTWPVIVEASWLLRRVPRGLALLCEFAAGAVEIIQLDAEVLPWIVGFCDRYRNLRPDLADASLVFAAERMKIGRIFTLDVRDFTVYRTSAGQSFHLLPDPHAA